MNKNARIATVVALSIVALLVAGLVIAGPLARGKPACNDGKDNDRDGLVDYPADPGCSSKEDRDEYNAPAAYCGDGSCNGAETCSSCQTDCGACGNQTNSTG